MRARPPAQQTLCGSLLVLTRFHQRRKPLFAQWLERMCAALESRPHKRMEFTKLRDVIVSAAKC